MVDVLTPLLAAVIISMVEYGSKYFSLRHKTYYGKILSFSAGVSITYIFLELLPLFTEKVFEVSKFLFLTLLFGFIAHHIIEKEIYQHNRKHELVKMLNLEENIFYYIYHVILGMLLVIFMQRHAAEGILFAVSILAYTIVSNLPAKKHKSQKRMIILSTSTLMGAVIGTFVWQMIPYWVELTLIGFATGVLLFTVTRHHIPYQRKGDIVFFLVGSSIYIWLILMKWLL